MPNTKNSNWSIDGETFSALVNAEGQHSIWPSAQPIPSGWTQVGPVGGKQDCLDWIKENWTDITPKSLEAGLN